MEGQSGGVGGRMEGGGEERRMERKERGEGGQFLSKSLVLHQSLQLVLALGNWML